MASVKWLISNRAANLIKDMGVRRFLNKLCSISGALEKKVEKSRYAKSFRPISSKLNFLMQVCIGTTTLIIFPGCAEEEHFGRSAIRAATKTFVNNAFVDVSAPRALELDELPGIVNDFRQAAANATADAAIGSGHDLHQRREPVDRPWFA